MPKTFDEVRKISKEYWNKFDLDPAWSPFIGSVGIFKIGKFQPDVSDDQKDDYCLVVGLLKELPPDLNLETEFQCVRVFTRVIGPVVAQAQAVLDRIDLADEAAAQGSLEDPISELASQITPEEKAIEDEASRQRMKRALDRLSK